MADEPKRYMLGLRGESKYQRPIKELSVGETVQLMHETDNRHDNRAVVALDLEDRRIGYAPRESWVQRALIDKKMHVYARVFDITGAGREHRGVVLEVFISDEEITARPASIQKNGGCVVLAAGLFGFAMIAGTIGPFT